MGTGSDYTVFQDHLGIPSLDLLFNRQGKGVYPYHSNYDSYYWLENFGDVGFKKHLAMSQLWGALVVRLAGVKILPFSAMEYARVLGVLVDEVRPINGTVLDLKEMKEAIESFKIKAKKLDQEASEARERGNEDMKLTIGADISASIINKHYLTIERAFLYNKGLPGRPWFKHIVSWLT